jgi:hypothetical protein
MNNLNDLYFELVEILKVNNMQMPNCVGIYNSPGHEYIELEWRDQIDNPSYVIELTVDKHERCTLFCVEYILKPFTTIDGFNYHMYEKSFMSELIFNFNDLRLKNNNEL